MPKKKKPARATKMTKTTKTNKKLMGEYQHEAGDRVHLLMTLLDEHILDHPYLKNDRELATLGEDAHDKLYELYQAIWRRDH